MAAISIVGRRRVTVGGLTDTDYFCANLHSEGPSLTLSPPRLCPPSYPRAPFSFSPLLTHSHSWYSNSSFPYLNYTFICHYPAAGRGSTWLRLTAVEAAAERVLNREEPSKCSKGHTTAAHSATGFRGFEPVDLLVKEGIFHPSEGKTFRCRLGWETVTVRKCSEHSSCLQSILWKVKMAASQMTNVQKRADSERLCV